MCVHNKNKFWIKFYEAQKRTRTRMKCNYDFIYKFIAVKIKFLEKALNLVNITSIFTL